MRFLGRSAQIFSGGLRPALAGLLAVSVCFAASAFDGHTEEPEKKSWEQKKSEEVMADIERLFQATGETKHCVALRQLRQSRVVDDQTIFFRFNGRRGYMNKLPGKCIRLMAEDRFSYNISGSSQLCRGEIITVLDNFGRPYGSCSLGDFEIWEKKPKEENKAEEK